MENLLVPYQATSSIPCKSVLVLAPHPDDEVFGCGGAIMRHVVLGTPVRVIVVSEGGHGVPPEERASYIRQRQRESEEAAKVLGYGAPIFWSYRDREINYGEKLINKILAEIDETKVDLIYAPSIWEMHPDHRAVGMAVVEAVRRIGKAVQLALYEVGMPLRPNCLLDISDLVDRKMRAMQCFVSQNEKQRYDLGIAALNRYRTYTLPAEVTAAEAYFLVAAEEFGNDPLKIYQSEYKRQKELGLVLDGSDLPLVSVIIRSMDRAILSDALDSVALQTYPNIEVIVVNAKGSGHRHLDEWCGRFPLRWISRDGSLSRSQAANMGLDAAKGEYLIFLNDADRFASHHIARLENELDQSELVIAAYSAVRCVNELGVETSCFAGNFDPLQFRKDNFIPILAVLFRRCVIDKGVRFDETLESCEDWDFWLQVLEYGNFQFIPELGATHLVQTEAETSQADDIKYTQRVMAAMYRKWLPRLSDEHLWAVMQHEHSKRLFDELNQTIAALNRSIVDRDITIGKILSSSSWRITKPMRFVGRFIRKIYCETTLKGASKNPKF